MKRGFLGSEPIAGLFAGQLLNWHGSVLGLGVAELEPGVVSLSSVVYRDVEYIPEPDWFSAGADRTTFSPAAVRAL